MGKGKLPLFCGNVERVIPAYVPYQFRLSSHVIIGTDEWDKEFHTST